MRDRLLRLSFRIRGRNLLPFYWGGLPLGWNRDVTVVGENQIRDVKTQIRGEEGEESNAWNCRDDERERQSRRVQRDRCDSAEGDERVAAAL